ncbi:hypothetical protein GF312_09015 [Candidatus Poribacteria bacterium]|nr:hypothetical protein [Candidatus Poribacteria bacterium]
MTKRIFLFILLFFAFTALININTVESQEPQLIARWPMDENSGDLIQDVVSDNDGELLGGKWVPAKFGSGIQFDKSKRQYVNIPKAPELEPDTPLTVMVWVNVDSAAGRQEVFCYGDSYVILINHGVFKTYIHQGGAFPRAPGDTPVEVNRWYFLAMTYDLEDLKLYVNGELDGEAKLPGSIDYLGLDLRFGNNPAAPAEAWEITGIVDEVEIWTTAMTEEQIMQAYQNPLAFLAVKPAGKTAVKWGDLKNR